MDPSATTAPQQTTFTSVQIKRINPVQAGKVLAVFYGLLALLFVPFMVLGVAFGGAEGAAAVIPMAFMALLYPVGGFIGGLIGAAVYNLVCGWVGGIEVELR